MDIRSKRVLGGCRNFIFRSVVICTQCKIFLGLLFKDVEMCGACSIHLRNEKCIQQLKEKGKNNNVNCIPKKNGHCRDFFICIVVESAQKSTKTTLRSQVVGDF